jgi:hypothetical protein
MDIRAVAAAGVVSVGLVVGIAVVGISSSGAASTDAGSTAVSRDRTRACSAEVRAERAGLTVSDHAVPKRWAAPAC